MKSPGIQAKACWLEANGSTAKMFHCGFYIMLQCSESQYHDFKTEPLSEDSQSASPPGHEPAALAAVKVQIHVS